MPLLRSSSLVIWVAVGRVSAAAGEEGIWACAAISFFCAAGEQSAGPGQRLQRARAASGEPQAHLQGQLHMQTKARQLPCKLSPRSAHLPQPASASDSAATPQRCGLRSPASWFAQAGAPGHAPSLRCREQELLPAGRGQSLLPRVSLSCRCNKQDVHKRASFPSSVLCLPPPKAIVNLGSFSVTFINTSWFLLQLMHFGPLARRWRAFQSVSNPRHTTALLPHREQAVHSIENLS